MDDLDRLALEVAISILQEEAETPASQTATSVKLARDILAELRQRELSGAGGLGDLPRGRVEESPLDKCRSV